MILIQLFFNVFKSTARITIFAIQNICSSGTQKPIKSLFSIKDKKLSCCVIKLSFTSIKRTFMSNTTQGRVSIKLKFFSYNIKYLQYQYSSTKTLKIKKNHPFINGIFGGPNIFCVF